VPAPAEGLSSFWPLVILAGGLLLWSGYQATSAYLQDTELNNEFQQAIPTLTAAQDARAKLYSMAQDLLQASPKDPAAAQIVKEANIQIKGPAAGAAPSGDGTGAPPASGTSDSDGNK
jgi:hypothetical protein